MTSVWRKLRFSRKLERAGSTILTKRRAGGLCDRSVLVQTSDGWYMWLSCRHVALRHNT